MYSRAVDVRLFAVAAIQAAFCSQSAAAVVAAAKRGRASREVNTMNERERFLRCMGFQKADRIPLMEMGVWPETLDRWHHEGLPKWVAELRHLEDYLGLDRSFNLNWLPINGEVYPPFETAVLEETADRQVLRDVNGVVYRQRKSHKTIPQFIRFPVENEADYERLSERLDGTDPGRYPADFDEDLHWRRQRGEIIGMNFRSFFGFHRNIMGMENLCLAFYDQPRLVQRMIADRLQFAKDVFARALATSRIDFVQVWEDMSYKTAAMISPKLIRQYMLSAYSELVRYLREGGVRVIMVDTDGRVDQLLPIFSEAGIDGTHPCEIAAGSDPLELRRLCPRCTLIGGLDKRRIANGRDGVDDELRRIQPLLKEGGYIPLLDHYVPPDVSYQTYCYYVERRRELL
jgi:uroporphyrinogen decarboxylase